MPDRRLSARFHASYGWDINNGGGTSRARKATKRCANQSVRRVPLEPDEHIPYGRGWHGPVCVECGVQADPKWHSCDFCGARVA